MDRFERHMESLVSDFSRVVGDSERKFLAETAQADFDVFRGVVRTLGWPSHGDDGYPLSGDSISDESRLLTRLRYPWMAQSCPPRANSCFSLSSVPAAWLDVVLALCEDVREALLDADERLLWLYALDQVKEKFGTLRWYDRCDLWVLDDGEGYDEGLEARWSAASRRIDLAAAMAEAVTSEICCVCGTSNDTWIARGGWIHIACPRCQASDFDHGSDVDGILAETGLRHWPWAGDVFDDARRYWMVTSGFSPVRSEIEGNLVWYVMSADGDQRVDVVRQAEAVGVRHVLDMVRDLDERASGDSVGAPGRDALVARLRALSS